MAYQDFGRLRFYKFDGAHCYPHSVVEQAASYLVQSAPTGRVVVGSIHGGWLAIIPAVSAGRRDINIFEVDNLLRSKTARHLRMNDHPLCRFTFDSWSCLLK
jgi:hypothetical protein